MKTNQIVTRLKRKATLILGIRGLFLFIFYLFSFQSNGQVTRELYVSDTRSVDSMPSTYKHVARFDFKYRSVIHIPGVESTGAGYAGLMTLAPWGDPSGGYAYQMSFDPQGLFLRLGNYTTNRWGNWSRLVLESSAGLTTLGNGSLSSGLQVKGLLKAQEINVMTGAWADDVFEKDYPLPSLTALEKQIQKIGHLPDMPSAQQVISKGIDLAEMNQKLLRKIEELTLYIIDQEKRIKRLETASPPSVK